LLPVIIQRCGPEFAQAVVPAGTLHHGDELVTDLEERGAASSRAWTGAGPFAAAASPLIQAGAVSGSGAAESVRLEHSQR
jgi:hypothetical protein